MFGWSTCCKPGSADFEDAPAVDMNRLPANASLGPRASALLLTQQPALTEALEFLRAGAMNLLPPAKPAP